MRVLLARPAARLVGALAMLALTAGCSKSDDPAGAAATLSGAVQLTARLYDALGKVTGERVVADAGGVRVHLRRPDGVTESSVTQHGRYSFAAGAGGTYRASCGVISENEVATPAVELAGGASGVFETLALGPVGDVRTYPNPFGSIGLSIEFEAVAGHRFDVIAYALSGDPVWRYSSEAVQGLNHIHWMGVDDKRTPLPGGAYWIVVRKDGRHHSNLVFKP